MRAVLPYIVLLAIFAAAPQLLDAQDVRSVPDSITEKMKTQKDFLYANDPSYWEKDQPKDNSSMVNFMQFLASPAMRIILYAVVGLIILFIIYQVGVVNNFFIFSGSKRKKAKKEDNGEELMPDDIDAKINEAVSAREYRVAIRYLYLKTLIVLNEKNLIKLHAKSTNNDYLNQMRQFPRFGEFAFLTRVYEYVWYGEFVPGEQQFEKIHQNFHQFISRS